MKICYLASAIFLGLLTQSAVAQSKMELQNFITQDMKSYAGTWSQTWNGKISQKATGYVFTILNCDLVITHQFTDDGVHWGTAKIVVPITDIKAVNLLPEDESSKKYSGMYSSTRLQIETSGHTMRRYWQGKLIDMDDSVLIGLARYTSDLAQKYQSTFLQYSKYCN